MAIKGVDSSIFERTDMKRALARRDITTVYRLLVAHGVSQRYLAELVGQSQSEVSEIMSGRQVQSYDVMVRVADGLNVSRGAMGLSYGGGDEGDGPTPVYDDLIDEDMRRRALLAAGAVALFGRPVLGEILELPQRPDSPTPLPDRLGLNDMRAMMGLTRTLEAEAKHYGGGYTVLSPVATRSERLLAVPADDAIKEGITTAVADLHNVAGWAAFDSHQDDAARYHFARAMTLGNEGDGFHFVKAAYLAGVATAERGAYNDGLKMLQLGQMRLSLKGAGQRTDELKAWLGADTACVLAQMGHEKEARSTLVASREGWKAPNADDQADMDWLTALVEIHLNQTDSAQELVGASVQRWTDTHDRRQAVLGRITLAQLYVQTGDSRGIELAHRAIGEVRELRSVRARERLRPMVKAMDARPEPHYRELAALARRSVAV
jgi:transcriptional regulator with XRE-family HTH domain